MKLILLNFRQLKCVNIPKMKEFYSVLTYLPEEHTELMSETLGQRIKLFCCELLMNNDGPLEISKMATRLNSSGLKLECENENIETRLEEILQSFPKHFDIRDKLVTLKKDDGNEDMKIRDSTSRRRSLPEMSTEATAVRFLQQQLAKFKTRSASLEILSDLITGICPLLSSSNLLRQFLEQHHTIFDIQGDNVSLKGDQVTTSLMPAHMTQSSGDLRNVKSMPCCCQQSPLPNSSKTPVIMPPSQRAQPFLDHPNFTNEFAKLQQGQFLLKSDLERPDSPLLMTANEYKMVVFLKDAVEKLGTEASIANLFEHINGPETSEDIRKSVGSTENELLEFMRKYSGVFIAEKDRVELVKNVKLDIISTGSRLPPEQMINNGEGKIFHVAKMWGIIDLGDHEHVFFDRSIMPKPVEDLRDYFEIGEKLLFTSVTAHKSSRARWKATRVWKENGKTISMGDKLTAVKKSSENSPTNGNKQLTWREQLALEKLEKTKKSSESNENNSLPWRIREGEFKTTWSSECSPNTGNKPIPWRNLPEKLNPVRRSPEGSPPNESKQQLWKVLLAEDNHNKAKRSSECSAPVGNKQLSWKDNRSVSVEEPATDLSTPEWNRGNRYINAINARKFVDSDLSEAGKIPIWNWIHRNEERQKKPILSAVQENHRMSSSALNDLRFMSDFTPSYLLKKDPFFGVSATDGNSSNSPKLEANPFQTKPKKFATVACQTVSTNDIVATQFFHDS